MPRSRLVGSALQYATFSSASMSVPDREADENSVFTGEMPSRYISSIFRHSSCLWYLECSFTCEDGIAWHSEGEGPVHLYSTAVVVIWLDRGC